MIENLKNELYQLENKHVKLGATLLWLIFWEKTRQVYLIIIREWPKNNSRTIRHKGVILDRTWRAKNALKLSSKYLVHGIQAKLVSNWEENMLYNESYQIFWRKKMSILTGLKV